MIYCNLKLLLEIAKECFQQKTGKKEIKLLFLKEYKNKNRSS